MHIRRTLESIASGSHCLWMSASSTFEKVGTEIQKPTETGVEIVGFEINDQETPTAATTVT